MNFVFLSPHFPQNFFNFCDRLNKLGCRVLGIADAPYDTLNAALKNTLTEYYKVSDMHNYDELMRAMGYLIHKYGKIDRIDSLNEYWLETEARLRTDFNIFGIKSDEIMKVKRKSIMKEYYRKAGVPVPKWKIATSLAGAEKWALQTGYPLIAKPDIGVGAAKTFKISNRTELRDFFSAKSEEEYILEEFVRGGIYTFDGLTGHDGNLLFHTSHHYSQGIMETVNDDRDVYYYSLRKIPADIEDAGRNVLKAFDVRERFFHFEFFRSEKNEKIIALEVNLRPPGGLTTDMFNYANNIDIYAEWANVVVKNQFKAVYKRPFHCCYISRKNNRAYMHTHEEILKKFEDNLCHHETISGVFSKALGDYGYIVRSESLKNVISMADFIQKIR